MITLNNLSLQRGAKILLQSVSLSFYDKYKVGIVGKNGSGKTSLLELLLGKLEPDTGEIVVATQAKMVTIEQEVPDTDRKAIDYVIDADQKLRKCEVELHKAEAQQDGNKMAELYEILQDIDGFSAHARAAVILSGLGFSEDTMAQPVNALSGGWRMRVNIARALFVPTDILLLDEPTNYLDLDAVIWLEQWLIKYPGLLLLISHDREFLDHITTHIAHINNQQIKLYTGNYSAFEKQWAETLALQQKQYEKQQKQIVHIQSFITRFKAKTSKARQAQSRIKALERMQEIMPAHIDSPFAFEFKESRPVGNPLLNLQHVSFSYADNLILSDINWQLNNQDRIGLLGKNGAGKSTFIKLLAGRLVPQQGEIFINKNLRIGYFAQYTLERLNPHKNALMHLQEIDEEQQPDAQLRRFLGGFNFSGNMAVMPVSNFSGGEKARLALALIIWQAPNLLLLDEPTNHLDIDMRQALILALQNYTGALIIVSHDRFLLKQVVDDYWLIADQRIQKSVHQ